MTTTKPEPATYAATLASLPAARRKQVQQALSGATSRRVDTLVAGKRKGGRRG